MAFKFEGFKSEGDPNMSGFLNMRGFLNFGRFLNTMDGLNFGDLKKSILELGVRP